jgi:phenylacetate-coenzyme A ligase PaaK-like adenylate-forming protein
MTGPAPAALDVPVGGEVDEEAFVRAAMAWHFDPESGSPFWLRRAETLDFDPRADVKGFDDLRLFPNVADELRDVPAKDLVPKGFGPRPDIVAVIESGGTTGVPKRIPLLREFADRFSAHEAAVLRRAGLSPTGNWLSLLPSGPHGAGEQIKRAAAAFGDGILVFAVDLDPRWVKKQVGAGNRDVVDEYVEHVVAQAAALIRTERISSMRVTAPVLARLVEDDDLVDRIRENLQYIVWGGASMDADSRYYYRTELFPGVSLSGRYGTTMALGAGGAERPALEPDAPCVFDPSVSPYVTMAVGDETTGERVPYGERGRLVVNHVSASFLLPNNAERDTALRVEPAVDQIGDSVADIRPVENVDGAPVVEGVY